MVGVLEEGPGVHCRRCGLSRGDPGISDRDTTTRKSIRYTVECAEPRK